MASKIRCLRIGAFVDLIIKIITALGALGPWHIFLIISILVAILVISIFGHVAIDWGKRQFSFGDNKSDGRSCKDCLMLLLGKRTQFEAIYNTKISTILRDQMNYVEHKLQEITFELENTYREDFLYFRKNVDNGMESKEFILYQELLRNSLYETKDEIRRSFKENGFHTMNNNEFDEYIKERSKLLLTIAREHIQRSYPMNMIIPVIERFKRYDTISSKKIDQLIRDMYVNAKEVRCRVEKELEELQTKFIGDVDSLVESKES